MNQHGSMNRIYRLVWSQVRTAWVPAAETARGRGKSGGRSACRAAAAAAAAAALSLAMVPLAKAGPAGGQIVAGKGSITTSGTTTDIRQSSQTLSLDWLSFNVAPQETVDFIQPNANAIAVNRIAGSNGSQILGHLDANGQVYLINPNGVVFGAGSQVNVGGLVASTLDLSDASLGSATRSFSGSGAGSVINEGTLNVAAGGSVALLGNHVSNQGLISAQLGTVAMAAGSAVTLTFNNNSLVHLTVDRSVLNSLAENHGLIQADGGQVLMTAGAQDALLASVVNNTGVIEARTVDDHAGTITLLGGMTAGTVNVGGTLDASAPTGGNGGFIETSAAHVSVATTARLTTAAASGLTGSWLIDPQDFTVAKTGGDISGATLSTELGTNNITLDSSKGAKAGSGNINIDDTVSWSKHKLTLTAANDIDVNAVMTATGSASLALNPATANGADAAVSTGTVLMGLNGAGFTGTVNFSGSGTLSIDGTTYTVINSLGAPGSTTGTDLQGVNGNLAGHYVLGSNIDASATSTWNSGAGFTPIGVDNSTPFKGFFNGLGHTIANLSIQRSLSYTGLFGDTYVTAVISNVGLTGGSVSGANYVGGLAGANNNIIVNSFARDKVTGTFYVGGLVGLQTYGSVASSFATGGISGNEDVGGLVGYNNGSVSDAYATGTVRMSDGFYAGGLVGSSSGTLTDSRATGNVIAAGSMGVGGLLGYNDGGQISGTYATGNVTASGSTQVGGLVGYNYHGSAIITYGTVTTSHATGTVTGSSYVGGLIGDNAAGASVSTSFATGAVKGSSYVGGLVGGNFGTITESYASGSASATATASRVGGLVGDNSHYGTISNSYATGAVSGVETVGGLVGLGSFGTVTDSYAVGAVRGSSYVGGLIGSEIAGNTTGSFWDVTTTGQTTSSGGIGMTTAQMQNKANFTSATKANGEVNPNWDFKNTWMITNGKTYPLLRALPPALPVVPTLPRTATTVRGNLAEVVSIADVPYTPLSERAFYWLTNR